MRLRTSPRFILLLLCVGLLPELCRAATLLEIEQAANLTPERFASFFSGFEFRFHNEVQPIDVFLSTHSGDCDDYAILAADVFRKRGYTPRLIAVRMPGFVHVVCYLEEEGAYLDYNLRAAPIRTVKSGPAIREIADKVAASYATDWRSASEFTFEKSVKRLVRTVVETPQELAAVSH